MTDTQPSKTEPTQSLHSNLVIDDQGLDAALVDIVSTAVNEEPIVAIRFERTLTMQSYNISPLQFANALRRLATRIDDAAPSRKRF